MIVSPTTHAAAVSTKLSKIPKGVIIHKPSVNCKLAEAKSTSRLSVNKLSINSTINVAFHPVDVDLDLLVGYFVSCTFGEEQQKTLQYISEKKLDPGRSG